MIQEVKNERILTITVSDKSELKITGDAFTVGEIESIGQELIRLVKSQNISFGPVTRGKPDPDLKIIEGSDEGEDKK